MSEGPVAKSKQISAKLQALRRKNLEGVGLDRDKHRAPYFEEDPRDEYYETKAVVAQDAALNRSALGNVVTIDKDDIQYELDQKSKTEKWTYDNWKLNTYKPGSDPVRLKFYEKIDPSYFQEREEEIERNLDFWGRIAKLCLNGPQSEEDVLLIYGLVNRRVPWPDWKACFPEDFSPPRLWTYGSQITQGYWNPKKTIVTPPVPLIPNPSLEAGKSPFYPFAADSSTVNPAASVSMRNFYSRIGQAPA